MTASPPVSQLSEPTSTDWADCISRSPPRALRRGRHRHRGGQRLPGPRGRTTGDPRRRAGRARGAHLRRGARSGAYVIHDDGYYAGISPLIPAARSARYGRRCTAGRGRSPGPNRNSRCSTPASGIYSFDEGLPVPQRITGAHSGVLDKAEVTALNDQHAFLRPPGSGADDVPVGTMVRLGPLASLHSFRQMAADPGRRRRRCRQPPHRRPYSHLLLDKRGSSDRLTDPRRRCRRRHRRAQVSRRRPEVENGGSPKSLAPNSFGCGQDHSAGTRVRAGTGIH